MIKEWNLSSLSSQTARPCPWTCKWSKRASTLEEKNCLHTYFDGHPPIIKAVRLRATGSLLDLHWFPLWPVLFGWVRVQANGSESSDRSDRLPVCPCIFCSWWQFACPPEFLRLGLQMPSALFGMSSSCHSLFPPIRDVSHGIRCIYIRCSHCHSCERRQSQGTGEAAT